MKPEVSIMWFRRDLRLTDNAALYHALISGTPVLPIFIFDRYILDKLEDKYDRRVTFIHYALQEMQVQLEKLNSSLDVYYDFPVNVFKVLSEKYSITKVFTNHDYEPYAKERDTEINNFLASSNITFHTYKDQVVFEKDEVLKDDGKPYTVFTPYSRKWKAKLDDFYLSSFPATKYYSNFYKQAPQPLPTLEAMGFQKVDQNFPTKELPEELIRKYAETRDFPGMDKGTSRLGVHLRFGTISARELTRAALQLNPVYVNELIWREFYQMILWHFPHVGLGKTFRPEYENIEWRNDEQEFAKWCEGQSGYPIVDAGMRELNATGFMHNRVRMVVASFLTKHLLIDYRWGEAYFAQKLLDYELASNNGGWQWAAGSGVNAAPYFRIFNPSLQMQKFDKQFKYTRKWVPEFEDFSYPKPIVDHATARARALEVFGKALRK